MDTVEVTTYQLGVHLFFGRWTGESRVENWGELVGRPRIEEFVDELSRFYDRDLAMHIRSAEVLAILGGVALDAENVLAIKQTFQRRTTEYSVCTRLDMR